MPEDAAVAGAGVGRRRAIGCRAGRRGGLHRAGLVALRLPYPDERADFWTPVETWRLEMSPVVAARSVG